MTVTAMHRHAPATCDVTVKEIAGERAAATGEAGEHVGRPQYMHAGRAALTRCGEACGRLLALFLCHEQPGKS